ncbi:MAG TPA: hypothetical protein VGB85_31675 [Nannocystis sp.]
MRWFVAVLVLLAGCRDQPVEARRAEVETMCAQFCEDRIACVADGYATGSVQECERKCLGDERPLEDNACGEASFAALECLTAVACEDLAMAVAAVDPDAACFAELRAQQDECDFTPLY